MKKYVKKHNLYIQTKHTIYLYIRSRLNIMLNVSNWPKSNEDLLIALSLRLYVPSNHDHRAAFVCLVGSMLQRISC